MGDSTIVGSFIDNLHQQTPSPTLAAKPPIRQDTILAFKIWTKILTCGNAFEEGALWVMRILYLGCTSIVPLFPIMSPLMHYLLQKYCQISIPVPQPIMDTQMYLKKQYHSNTEVSVTEGRPRVAPSERRVEALATSFFVGGLARLELHLH